jgi:drug/metabolite transporter (DMT)-like permease
MQAPTQAGQNPKATSLQLFLAFVAIYIIWGSTYLAIRYAIESIPPLITAGTRHLIAGTILLLWCWRRGSRPQIRYWIPSIILGALFFLGGHGTLHWAEKRVPSGLAALLIATEPIVIVLLGAVIPPKAKPRAASIFGLVTGTVGVALLMGAEVFQASRAAMIAGFAVLFSSISWSVGVIYSRRAQLPRDPYLNAAMSMLTGSAMLLLTGAFTGEFTALHPAAISLRSGLALAYLIVFGSLIAYSAYMWLLEHRSPALVATHAYVNPVVAVVLGWLLASEQMNLRTLFAGALIIFAIIFVSRGTRSESADVSAKIAAVPRTAEN